MSVVDYFSKLIPRSISDPARRVVTGFRIRDLGLPNRTGVEIAVYNMGRITHLYHNTAAFFCQISVRHLRWLGVYLPLCVMVKKSKFFRTETIVPGMSGPLLTELPLCNIIHI